MEICHEVVRIELHVRGKDGKDEAPGFTPQFRNPRRAYPDVFKSLLVGCDGKVWDAYGISVHRSRSESLRAPFPTEQLELYKHEVC